jgi:hypothetical protein
VERLLEESEVIMVCCQSIKTEGNNAMENIHFYRTPTQTQQLILVSVLAVAVSISKYLHTWIG